MMKSYGIRRTDRIAFTLIELLVVVAIIAVLISILLPALKSARDKAKEVACSSNERQINLALQGYLNDCNGRFPPYYDFVSAKAETNNPSFGGTGYTWFGRLLSYKKPKVIPILGVYENADINFRYLSAMEVLLCPSKPAVYRINEQITTYGLTGYGLQIFATLKLNPSTGVFDYSTIKQDNVLDPSTKIAFVDSARYSKPMGASRSTYYVYGTPRSPEYGQIPDANGDADDACAYPRHNGVCNVLWFDGHVSGVRAVDPSNPTSLYWSDALGQWAYDTPGNKWYLWN